MSTNNIDEKRFSIVPLSFKNKERSLPGEIVIDDETGNVWVRRREDGVLVCATQNINEEVRNNIEAYMANFGYALSVNSSVYRLYFNGNSVRLDNSLDFPTEYVYYQIRDLKDASAYYLTGLTRVLDKQGQTITATSVFPEQNEEGTLKFALEHNGNYIVEFYNLSLEKMSEMVFTAKKAPNLSIDGLDKYVDHIEISVNRDTLYLGESIKSLNVRVYAVMGDESYLDASSCFANGASEPYANYIDAVRLEVESVDELTLMTKGIDITNSNLTAISLDNIDTDVEGTYKIRAFYFDKLNNYRKLVAEREIKVSSSEAAKLVKDGMVLVPEYTEYADGRYDIKLRAIGYFEDGSVRDVTNEVIIRKEDELVFDESGIIDVKAYVSFRGPSYGENLFETRIVLYKLDSYVGYKTVKYVSNTISTGGILRLSDEYVEELNKIQDNKLVENGVQVASYKILKLNHVNNKNVLVPMTHKLTPIGMPASFIGTFSIDAQTVVVELYDITGKLYAVDTVAAIPVEEV